MCVAAPFYRGRTRFFDENLVEIRVIAISAFRGYFLNRARGCFEKIHRPLDFNVVYIFKRCFAEFLFEYADNVVFAVMKMKAYFREGGNRRNIFVDKA